MVRSIMGTMLDIEIKNESISTFETILKSKIETLQEQLHLQMLYF